MANSYDISAARHIFVLSFNLVQFIRQQFGVSIIFHDT